MKNVLKTYAELILGISFLFSPLTGQAALNVKINKPTARIVADSSLSTEIKRQLLSNELSLYYPNSVKSFYQNNNFTSPWLKQQSETGNTWQAMLLIDCVLQYGLCHDDYHPKELTYYGLHDILEKPGTISLTKQARFDIMLTDAMLNMINNLHFGKLNPVFSAKRIDRSKGDFRAEQILAQAINKSGFMAAIANVQPKSKEYLAMQYQMHLWMGVYAGDCYEIPESKIRKLAINMERSRWDSLDTGAYIQINIPSFTLNLHEIDSIYSFKVVVGKPETPSPTLQTRITYFTTSPKRNAKGNTIKNTLSFKSGADSYYPENVYYVARHNSRGYLTPTAGGLLLNQKSSEKNSLASLPSSDNVVGSIVFHFPNNIDLSLSGTPNRQVFKKEIRDFSNRGIIVDQDGKLAGLLLKYNNGGNTLQQLHKAISQSRSAVFNLNKPVAIKVTYLTCIVKDGKVLDYKDIYDLDKGLEMALYNANEAFALR